MVVMATKVIRKVGGFIFDFLLGEATESTSRSTGKWRRRIMRLFFKDLRGS